MSRSQLALLGLMAMTTAAEVQTRFGAFNWTHDDPRVAIFKAPRAVSNFSMQNFIAIEVSTASWGWTNTSSSAGNNDTVTSGALLRLLGRGVPAIENETTVGICAMRMVIQDEAVRARGRDGDGCDFLGDDCADDLWDMGACVNGEDKLPAGIIKPRCNFNYTFHRVQLPPSVYSSTGFLFVNDTSVDASNATAVTNLDHESMPIVLTRQFSRSGSSGDVDSTMNDLRCVRAQSAVTLQPTSTVATPQPTSTSSSLVRPTAPAGV
jgi:hypothetical protein